MKNIIMVIIIGLFTKDISAEQKRPDYGKIVRDGMIKGVKGMSKSIPNAIKKTVNEIKKQEKKEKKLKIITIEQKK